MEPNKPSVFFENREYFYSIVSKTPTEIIIVMYSTNYILVKDKDGKWVNHLNNRYQLANGLLAAAIDAIKD